MDLSTYEKLIKTENTAKKYLLGFCWKNHQRFCPRCKCRKLYTLSDKKRRCSRCGYTFHDFSQRFINQGNMSSQQWLRLIKLFELDVPPRKAAEQMNVSYNTVFKAITTIRWSILCQALDAPQMFSAGIFPPSRGDTFTLPTLPVYGVMERAGIAFVDLIPGMSPDTVIHFKLNFHLKTAALGSVIYTDSYRDYDALLFCAPRGAWPYLKHSDKGLLADSSKGFWRYAKERLHRHQGITPARFPLYLKEFEFRYNNAENDIFPMIVERLCEFVPNLT